MQRIKRLADAQRLLEHCHRQLAEMNRLDELLVSLLEQPVIEGKKMEVVDEQV